jgi:hypothetical protein
VKVLKDLTCRNPNSQDDKIMRWGLLGSDYDGRAFIKGISTLKKGPAESPFPPCEHTGRRYFL